MCGICGKVYREPARSVEPAWLAAMMAAIAHRGPDAEGQALLGQAGLGFRRLSIIDLETGDQPIPNEDRTLWIVFNGEIYNYRALRADLEARGHRFRTHTDTETILHLFEDDGPDCLARLDGMFALAIWDAPRRQLFLARDRLGEKPLYYADNGERILFASEIKALRMDPGFDPEIHWPGLDSYLSLRFVPAPATLYRHATLLPAGHCLLWKEGQVRQWRYWTPSFLEKTGADVAAQAAELADRLRDSVRKRLVSDVPLGAFLSGGMDSSLVVAMMGQVAEGAANTFAAGCRDVEFNELPYARAVAERWHTRHREFMIEPDVVHALPKIVHLMDGPTDPVALSLYHISGATRQHVKVALGGDGGDELFGGYDRYWGNRMAAWAARVPRALRRIALDLPSGWVQEDFTRKSLSKRLRWIHQMADLPADRRYFASLSFFRFGGDFRASLYTADLHERLADSDPAAPILEAFRSPNAEDPVDRMLYTDLTMRLPNYTLQILDRMTMAHGLEGRCPYLAHGLVEYGCRLPSSSKVRGWRQKWLQKRLARAYLPETVLRRGKQGFSFPLSRWFREDLRDFLHDLVLDSRLVRDGLFAGDTVRRLVGEHDSGTADHSMRLWSLLNCELWYRDLAHPANASAPGREARRP